MKDKVYLKIKEDVAQPTITDHDVLIKAKSAGVNPIEYFTVSNIQETLKNISDWGKTYLEAYISFILTRKPGKHLENFTLHEVSSLQYWTLRIIRLRTHLY